MALCRFGSASCAIRTTGMAMGARGIGKVNFAHFRQASLSKRAHSLPLSCHARLSGTDHRSKFLDQCRRLVGLSDKATVRREIGGLKLMFSRHDQYLDGRPAVARRMGQFQQPASLKIALGTILHGRLFRVGADLNLCLAPSRLLRP